MSSPESLPPGTAGRGRSRAARLRRTGLLALLALLGAAGLWAANRDADGGFDTVTLGRGDIEATVDAIGTLQPRRYVDVGAQVSGQVRRLYVRAGDVVEQGQKLAEIDPTVQQATVDASRAALAGLKAQLADQQARHRLAQHQHARQLQMARDGATRDEDVQVAEAERASTAARIDHLKAQIDQAQSTLQGNLAQLGYTRIDAPMAGTVVSLDAREGQTLNAAYQTPNVLRIADLSTMTVWTEVSEAEVRRVRAGMPVHFTTLGGTPGQAKRRWSGTVRQVLPAPQQPEGKAAGTALAPTTSKVVLYTVLFDVANADGELMPQMTAQVSFVTAAARGVLTAPLPALQPVSGQPGRYKARVLDADGRPQPRELRIGVRDRLTAEVLEGLAEGDRLVTAERSAGSGVRRFQF
ncbi:efflux RND transporter periplasmic adaptor subunit [Variovorax saccharolyticus]|uniref:efflux RND transporter periplasmic adaptor subunit n=1 Tax=Variovorax saccharolyticus TaxID=3053516 RepID=UPI00257921A1|nr:efflux RND transporter periplasmic adaptor subunit [Variovorax sp. J22R187]MDM0021660.1 efflux RND transporter periplasmic adaptor subunit [Variovorax sp. J22R187]